MEKKDLLALPKGSQFEWWDGLIIVPTACLFDDMYHVFAVVGMRYENSRPTYYRVAEGDSLLIEATNSISVDVPSELDGCTCLFACGNRLRVYGDGMLFVKSKKK